MTLADKIELPIERSDGVSLCLEPSFSALVAAEEELGPLFALVERASAGELRLAELVALFWHCLTEREGLTRETFGQSITDIGLATASKSLRLLLGKILRGEH